MGTKVKITPRVVADVTRDCTMGKVYEAIFVKQGETFVHQGDPSVPATYDLYSFFDDVGDEVCVFVEKEPDFGLGGNMMLVEP